MKFVAFALCITVVLAPSLVAHAQTAEIFSEDFEGLDLGPFQMENLPAIPALDPSAVWTKTPPEGWTVDDSAMPGGGVTDWRGWAFANVAAWAFVAGDQRRSEFTKASGTVAIADPDEWDDAARDDGLFFGIMTTGDISLDGVSAGPATFTFDSSWRPFANQTAEIIVFYSTGDSEIALAWSSDEGSPDFHNDENTNETVTVELNIPAGATSMSMEFALFDAGNDWFWAIDNLELTSGGTTFWTEDFEGLPLESFQMENLPDNIQPISADNVWTKTPPAGWEIDDSAMPADGVLDWRGWAIALNTAWATVAGDQRRFEFTKGSGSVAIADPDEWDDAARDEGTFNSFMTTPDISLENVVPGSTLTLEFDSSWRPYANQRGAISVVTTSGSEEIVVFSSVDTDPFFKDDNSTNDTILQDFTVPAGIESFQFQFALTDAGNDWFWAIDNIRVTAELIETSVESWSLY